MTIFKVLLSIMSNFLHIVFFTLLDFLSLHCKKTPVENGVNPTIQYNILLQAICSEVDVVIKRLYFEFNSSIKVKDMSDYINCLLTYEPNIKTQEVKLNLYNMKFTPWENIGYYTNKDGTKKLIAPYW